jgi:hypothetical protein
MFKILSYIITLSSLSFLAIHASSSATPDRLTCGNSLAARLVINDAITAPVIDLLKRTGKSSAKTDLTSAIEATTSWGADTKAFPLKKSYDVHSFKHHPWAALFPKKIGKPSENVFCMGSGLKKAIAIFHTLHTLSLKRSKKGRPIQRITWIYDEKKQKDIAVDTLKNLFTIFGVNDTIRHDPTMPKTITADMHKLISFLSTYIFYGTSDPLEKLIQLIPLEKISEATDVKEPIYVIGHPLTMPTHIHLLEKWGFTVSGAYTEGNDTFDYIIKPNLISGEDCERHLLHLKLKALHNELKTIKECYFQKKSIPAL